MWGSFSWLFQDDGWIEVERKEEVEIDYTPSCTDCGPSSSSLFGEEEYIHGVSNYTLENLLILICFLPLIILCFILLFRKGKNVVQQEYQAFVDKIRGNHVHRERERREGGLEGECPICLDNYYEPVVTNCNHRFCGSCILDFWEISSNMGTLSCPLCRRSVTLIQPWLLADENSPILDRIARFNRRMAGNATFFDRIRDVPSLLGGMRRNMSWRVVFRSLFVIKRLLFIVAGVCYIFSPFDLIPETVFGVIGLIDDFLAFLLILFVVAECFRQFILQQQRVGRGGQ
mmetsp:Transcript_580/g.972  ORF Transcript_580/g.972 Transcript_580/m.972 type:complete len:287 (-) Transcript_580:27-887(-)